VPSTITGSINAMFHTTLAHNKIAPAFSLQLSPRDVHPLTLDISPLGLAWPGLTSSAVCKYLPQSMAMHQVHLDQIRMNSSFTQPRTPLLPTAPPQQPTADMDAAHNAAPPDPPTLHSGTIYDDFNCTTGMI
jgi:hypothetical protein